MESRNISLTLEKAREWYNSGSADLKEVALQAYTEEELTIPEFAKIKTFEDACRALGVPGWKYRDDIVIIDSKVGERRGGGLENIDKHLIAIYKLDIIRKALNKGWNPKMTEDTIYYPYVRLYPAGGKATEVARSNSWLVGETFIADGEKYSLIGGDYPCFCNAGLGNFGYGFGAVSAALGLLGCKSKEIAQHMSRYFAKEIFEACYSHHVGVYKWV